MHQQTTKREEVDLDMKQLRQQLAMAKHENNRILDSNWRLKLLVAVLSLLLLTLGVAS